MKQITQGEMAELKRLLAIVGLDVKRKPKPKLDPAGPISQRIARVRAWTPQSGSGRACKASMLRTLAMVQAYGYSNDRYAEGRK